MDELAEFSRMNDNVDFAGRIVWKDVTDKDGNVLLDEMVNLVATKCSIFGEVSWFGGLLRVGIAQTDSGLLLSLDSLQATLLIIQNKCSHVFASANSTTDNYVERKKNSSGHHRVYCCLQELPYYSATC